MFQRSLISLTWITRWILLTALFMALTACQPGTPQATSPSPAAQGTGTSSAMTPTAPPESGETTPTEIPSTATPSALPPTPTPVSRVISPPNAAQVAALGRLGGGSIIGAPVYSQDGRLLAVPTSIGIDLYDAATLDRLRSFPARSMLPVAFSSDGDLLAAHHHQVSFPTEGVFSWETIQIQEVIQVWRVEDATLVNQIVVDSGTEYNLWDMAFSPDGDFVVAGYRDEYAKIWRVADGQELYTIKGIRPAFSPDASLLVTMPPEGIVFEEKIYLYSLAEGTLLDQWDGQRAVFIDDRQLAVENAGAVRVIDLLEDKVRYAFNGSRAAFSANGEAVSLYDNGSVKIYSLLDGALQQTLEGFYEGVERLYIAPDGQTVTGLMRKCSPPDCAFPEPLLVLWRASDGAILRSIQDLWYYPWLWPIYAPDGHTLLFARTDGLDVWDSLDGTPLTALDGYTLDIAGLAFSPDGETLATLTRQYPLNTQLWNLAEAEPIQRVQAPGTGWGDTLPVVFSPDGQTLVVRGDIWRVSGNEPLILMEQRMADVAQVAGFPADILAYSPDGKTIAMGAAEKGVALLNLTDLTPLHDLEDYKGTVNSLAFSPGGEVLAAAFGYPDFVVQLWRVSDGKPLVAIPGQEWWHEFTQVVFSPDGLILATVAKSHEGIDPGVVQLWNPASGDLTFQLDTNSALRVAFSPDGALLATGSYDRLVRLWNTANGELLAALGGHSDDVTDLAFSPDGTFLASGSLDGTVLLWGIPDPE